MNDSRPSDELGRLTAAICEGSITVEQSQRLGELLRTDAAARTFYLDYIELHGVLAWDLSPTQAGSAAKTFLLPAIVAPDESFTEPELLPLLGELTSTRSESASASRPSLPALTPKKNWRFSQSTVCSVSLVALCFYGTFLLMAWNLRSDKVPVEADDDGRIVATVSAPVDARWSEQSALRPKFTAVKQGELLKLDTGVVELELNRGVKLSIEGPAQWFVDSENGVTLNVGRLIANVPKTAIGFTITTPTAKVVDLGTEFGVRVSPQGAAEVAVLAGQVDVTPVDRTDQARLNPRRLIAGEAVRVDVRGNIQNHGSALATFKALRSQTQTARDRTQSNSEATPNPSGIHLWLRADQGVELDAKGCVERWRDQSGHDFDAIQSEPNQRPLFVYMTARGRGRAVAFDGLDDWLTCDRRLEIDNAGDLTLFLLLADVPKFAQDAGVFSMRPRTGNDGESPDGLAIDLNINNLHSPTAINARQGNIQPLPPGSDPIILRGPFEPRWPLLLVVTKQQGVATLRINGETRTVDQYKFVSAADQLINTLGYAIAKRIDRPSFGNISIAELLVFDRAFTGGQATTIEAQILARYARPFDDP